MLTRSRVAVIFMGHSCSASVLIMSGLPILDAKNSTYRLP
jgi:hypothetical protein